MNAYSKITTVVLVGVGLTLTSCRRDTEASPTVTATADRIDQRIDKELAALRKEVKMARFNQVLAEERAAYWEEAYGALEREHEGLGSDAASSVPLPDASRDGTPHASEMDPVVADSGSTGIAVVANLPEPVEREVIDAVLLSDTTDRWEALKRLGVQLGNDDFKRVLEGAGDGYRSRRTIGETLSQWVQSDPATAARWVEELEEGRDRERAVGTLAGAWAELDAAAAARWIEGLPAGETRDQAIARAARSLTAADARLAVRLSESMSDPDVRAQAVSTIVAEWSGTDAAAARTWVQTLPGGDLRDAGLQRLAAHTAASDPTEALALIGDIASSETREDAYGHLAFTWAQNDAVAASDWLNGLETGEEKDTAVRSFSRAIAETHPQMALTWAQSVGEERTRERALRGVLFTWARADREAATQWVASSDMPENEKATMSRMLERASHWRGRRRSAGGFGR